MLERSHQTLKTLLGKYALESEKEWDDNIDLLLFMMSSVPNESTGVTHYEMLFGRKARYVLKIVKETLIGEVEVVTPVTVAKYLQNMKDKFDKIHKFASDNMKISKGLLTLARFLVTHRHASLRGNAFQHRNCVGTVFGLYRGTLEEHSQRRSNAEKKF